MQSINHGYTRKIQINKTGGQCGWIFYNAYLIKEGEIVSSFFFKICIYIANLQLE